MRYKFLALILVFVLAVAWSIGEQTGYVEQPETSDLTNLVILIIAMGVLVLILFRGLWIILIKNRSQ